MFTYWVRLAKHSAVQNLWKLVCFTLSQTQFLCRDWAEIHLGQKRGVEINNSHSSVPAEVNPDGTHVFLTNVQKLYAKFQ